MTKRLPPLFALFLLAAAAAAPLEDTRKPDGAYAVRATDATTIGDVKVTHATLTSQTWKGREWTHRLRIYRPPTVTRPGFCTLFISGSGDASGEDFIGAMLAKATGAAVAVLMDVPNQPLYGGKNEDELIAYTWTEYLKSGDETWPLLLPMTESALRAMDAVQILAKRAGLAPIKSFVVTGASKRGWTTWLTAATKDTRVKGIAPMVIDVLNMAKQLPHQVESYGKASGQIGDYERAGLLQALETARGKRLLEIVDPYSYRKDLKPPKLVILGTNDPYWTQDALNLYWDDLPGSKWVLYTPNSGHGLDDRMRVFATLSAFARGVADGKPLPQPSWTWAGNRLTVKSAVKPASARFWTATAKTRDFRDSKWTPKELTLTGSTVTATLAKPASGFAVGFVELSYGTGAEAYTVSTQLRIVGA